MKCKAMRALQLVLGLLLFSVVGSQDSALGLVVEQVRAIGPGPWVRLVAGAQFNGLRETMAKVSSMRSTDMHANDASWVRSEVRHARTCCYEAALKSAFL
jgi:hypothetical protein